MVEKIRPSWAEIDLDAIGNNIKEVKRVSGDKEIIAVIKADGYGHGAVEIYRELINGGATRFAVAVITEAIELRKSGLNLPIIVLGFTGRQFYDEILDFDIEQTVYTYEDAKSISEVAVTRNAVVKIHIAVDTGMRRIGFSPTRDNANEVLRIYKLEGISIVGIFTHFATADEVDKGYTNIQIERFNKFNDYIKELGVNIDFKHVSNSAAIIDLPNLDYQGVRAGIMLYGYYPSRDVNTGNVNLIPAMTLKSKIINIQMIEAGEGISYGRVFTTARYSKIGTLPIGYADGVSRLLTGKGNVIVNGKVVPIVGRICMDQCMIDLTDVPCVKKGDEVILIGKDNCGNSITANDMADYTGTINYEIVCGISKRIPRVYVKNGEDVKVRNYV
ncbi:MAG: alanine racemase [Clostridium sp.]|uniref:alanine racemase n=1 Tax=Clostridium sp. TaxID=1506 RepID=UPI003069D855